MDLGIRGKRALVCDYYNAILARIPAGRWGETEDFKGVTVFLASSASDYVSGTVITVDGGWMGR